MATKLTKGTKEIVPVDILDRTGVTTDLSTATPKFTLMKDDNSTVYSDATATGAAMRISCLVDTSSGGPGGLLPVGHYRLFVKFTVGSEVVVLGPEDIYIVDT